MQQADRRSGSRLLTGGLVFMVTATAFEGLAVPTVLPAALEELGGLPLYGWAFAAFWLTNLIGITVAGHEADRRGPLAPFLAGVTLFAVGLGVAAVAPSMAWVVAGRVIQGLGAGAIASIIYVVIARGYSTAEQPRMIAVISSAWVLPGIIGPAAAGYVAQELSWRWAFAALVPLLPLAALLLVGPMRRLAAAAPSAGPSGAARRMLDAVQLAIAAGLLLAAGGAGHPALSAAAVLAGGVLIVRPLQRLLPGGTLRARPGQGAITALIALVSAAFFGAEAFVPLSVSSVRGAGTIVGGLSLAAAAVTWAAGSWVQARLGDRSHRGGLVAGGVALIGVGIAIEAAVPVSSLPVYAAAAGWAVAGLGMGISYSLATLLIIRSAPTGEEGAASASIQLAEALGIALGTGLAGSIVAIATARVGLAPAIAVAELLMLVLAGITIAICGRLLPGVDTLNGKR
ncbi:MAG TPA: MFS transporter [Candidatus Limnocylindria bacterium]|nr:MFS transporter [Candidatus Limnocylindria bacterium]